MGKLTGFKEYKREVHKARPVSERIKDYKELYINLPKDKIREQAARCMNCGTPFCNWGCPLSNIAPDFNDFVYNDEWVKAYDKLSLTNTFPEFTGRVCPALCESSCTLGVNSDPISIKEIELAIIENAFRLGIVKPRIPKVRTGKKVAVIGSGPSGLSTASQLNSVGHYVTVFEKSDAVGGLLRYGIPDFKLDKGVIDRRIKVMEEEGIKFKTNVDVGKDIKSADLLNDFDAIVLCGGSEVPRPLNVPGKELEGVYFAVDYLRAQNKRNRKEKVDADNMFAKGKTVVVIGGGDTGSDCIGTVIRQGAKKVYQYEIMPKPPENRTESMPWPTYPRTLKTTTSHEEGCIREWCVSTKELIGKNGRLEKLKGVTVKWSKDKNGKMSLTEVPGTEFEKKVDIVLIAMGFLHPKHEGILDELKIEYDNRGNIFTDEKYMTNVKGVFAAGDMHTGQSLVVKALHDGRMAAMNVDNYLMGETSLRG